MIYTYMHMYICVIKYIDMWDVTKDTKQNKTGKAIIQGPKDMIYTYMHMYIYVIGYIEMWAMNHSYV